MRILDKNTDFYDYLQNIYPDDSLTFDRTDSFLLSKEILCQHLIVPRTYSRVASKYKRDDYNFLLLQVCNTFWLFLIKLTKVDEYRRVTDYTMELLIKWQNFDKPRKLIQLDIISLSWGLLNQLSGREGFWRTGYAHDKLVERSSIVVQAINQNEYRVESNLNHHVIYQNEPVEKHIPLLKACGIASWVNPLDIFLALEEYFSLEKTASERTEAIGSTNDDKIESHGFDVKTSFRGKQT